MLKRPYPSGVTYLGPLRIIKANAPNKKSSMERNLTITIIICITLVLSILRKLKAAPETKKTAIQKLNYCKTDIDLNA
jgi:uncharacterized protein YutE (UPF0331/DUF86 family)